MLKEPIDIIYGSVPCAGAANRSRPQLLAPREFQMRELTSAEIDQVCSFPPAPPVPFAEFAPQKPPGEQALAMMLSLR